MFTILHFWTVEKKVVYFSTSFDVFTALKIHLHVLKRVVTPCSALRLDTYRRHNPEDLDLILVYFGVLVWRKIGLKFKKKIK
jgi:hypothetical protein